MRKELDTHETRLFQDENLKGKTIFEIGFGDGSDHNIFKSKYQMKVFGIDINNEIVKNVKSKMNEKNLFNTRI